VWEAAVSSAVSAFGGALLVPSSMIVLLVNSCIYSFSACSWVSNASRSCVRRAASTGPGGRTRANSAILNGAPLERLGTQDSHFLLPIAQGRDWERELVGGTTKRTVCGGAHDWRTWLRPLHRVVPSSQGRGISFML
jgi:hypothetical protein